MKWLEKIITKSDLAFAFVVATYSVWSYALELTSFSAHIFMRILFYYLVRVLVFTVILAIMEKVIKHSVFGRVQLSYFPWRQAIGIATILSAVIGIVFGLFTNKAADTQFIATWIIGFALSSASIIMYLHSLVKK